MRGLFCILFRRIFSRLIRIERVYFFETDPRLRTDPVVSRVPVEIRIATSADIRLYADDLERLSSIGPREAQELLDTGRLAYIALCHGSLSAVFWLGFGAQIVSEIDMTLMLAADEACGFGLVTDEKWRGMGIMPAIYAAIYEYERGRGVTRHIYWIRADNAPSIRVAEKTGRKLAATVTTFWVYGMRHARKIGVPRNGSLRLVTLSDK